MTKFLMIILGALLVVAPVGYAEDQIRLTAATINPADSFLATVLQAYAQELRSDSNNQIQLNIFTGNQLGDASNIYESVVNGSIDIAYSEAGWFTKTHPEFAILEGNYLFKNQEQFISIVNDEFKLDLFKNKLLKNPGVVVLFIAGGLERNIFSTYPIYSIEDLKEKTMRSKPTATNMIWWHALGANPVPVSFKDIYTAVQDDVVKGSQNTLDSMLTMDFIDIYKYIARTQHNIGIGFVIMNKKKFDLLGENIQTTLKKTAQKIQRIYLEEAFKISNEKLSLLENTYNIKVTYPDKTPFIKASRKLIDELALKYGILDEIHAIFN